MQNCNVKKVFFQNLNKKRQKEISVAILNKTELSVFNRIIVKPKTYQKRGIYLLHGNGRQLAYPLFQTAFIESAYLF